MQRARSRQGPRGLTDRAGQLVYINRDKDVVVVWSGTNQDANPKLEPIPCRIIANTFF